MKQPKSHEGSCLFGCSRENRVQVFLDKSLNFPSASSLHSWDGDDHCTTSWRCLEEWGALVTCSPSDSLWKEEECQWESGTLPLFLHPWLFKKSARHWPRWWKHHSQRMPTCIAWILIKDNTSAGKSLLSHQSDIEMPVSPCSPAHSMGLMHAWCWKSPEAEFRISSWCCHQPASTLHCKVLEVGIFVSLAPSTTYK